MNLTPCFVLQGLQGKQVRYRDGSLHESLGNLIPAKRVRETYPQVMRPHYTLSTTTLLFAGAIGTGTSLHTDPTEAKNIGFCLDVKVRVVDVACAFTCGCVSRQGEQVGLGHGGFMSMLLCLLCLPFFLARPT